MKLLKLIEAMGLETVTVPDEDPEIITGYTSDLLSDVLGNAADEGVLLITIQAHKNTVAVAFQINAPAILICNGREIPADMLETAKKQEIAVLRTPDNQFVSSYKAHKALFG